MDKEKRQHPRFDSLNTVAYFCLDEEGRVIGQGMGRTLNLSQSGILMHVYRILDDCRLLTIHLGLRDELIEVRGHVVHRRDDRAKGFQYGIEFIDVSAESRRTLSRFVEQFNAV